MPQADVMIYDLTSNNDCRTNKNFYIEGLVTKTMQTDDS